MDPLTLSLISNGVGGLISFLANSSANERAQALQNEALQQWIAIQVPDPAQQRLVLERFVNQGQLAPVLEQAISQNPSEFQKVVVNPGYKRAQDQALEQLEQASQGGLDLQDEATQQAAMQKSQMRAQSNQDAIQQDMAQRGLSGSGYDVAARLANRQQQQDIDAQVGLQTAAAAQQRALEAIEKGGALAGQLSQQDFNQQAQRATAQDAINNFNTRNAQGVMASNVGIMNTTNAANLSNAQDIANKNTASANKAAEYNSNLYQQQFENNMAKQKGVQSIYDKKSQLEQQQGQNLANTASNFGQAAGNTFAAKGQQDRWDKYFDSKNSTSSPVSASDYSIFEEAFNPKKKTGQTTGKNQNYAF